MTIEPRAGAPWWWQVDDDDAVYSGTAPTEAEAWRQAHAAVDRASPMMVARAEGVTAGLDAMRARAEAAEADLSALAAVVGCAVVASSLAPGESVVDPPRHAIFMVVERLRARAEAAEARATQAEAAGYRRAIDDACAVLDAQHDEIAGRGTEWAYDDGMLYALDVGEQAVRALAPVEPVSKADELPAKEGV